MRVQSMKSTPPADIRPGGYLRLATEALVIVQLLDEIGQSSADNGFQCFNGRVRPFH